jgi:peptidoglycan-associated lipoprotein
MMRARSLPLLLLALLVLGACGRRPAPVEAPAPAPAAAPVTDDAAARAAAAERARIEAEAARRREEIARAREILATSVHFDFDSYSIREDSRQALDAKLPFLRAEPAIRLSVAGHADERGSTEYNLALGMRRAQAVREYLGNLGVSEGRIEVTSFGEERPLDPGQNEAAWARNRRAEFDVAGLAAQ